MIELPIEQEFTIASFNALVDSMSREQAIDTLKQLNRAYVTQRVIYLELLKKEWQLESH